MRQLPLLIIMSVFGTCCWGAETVKESRASIVAALHATVITPASNALFQAESSPPSKPGDWGDLRASALRLAQSAKQLTSKELAKGQNDWLKFAQALNAAAVEAAHAAEAKNQEALVAANGHIVSICEDCHDQYRDGGHGMKK